MWNGLHESVFAGEGVGAFKTSVNRFLLQGGPLTYRFSAFTHVVFVLVFLEGV